ncbi:DNA adenine methylase [Anaerostipes hadrus]|uniref:DNA adenine methylase n=1 Tax=Anaerostipes hadrus TaxID=649756 RepID=UPI0018998537
MLKKRLSPLRYPGGKSKLIDQLLPYIQDKECFVEAFCGGSSLGLALLDAGKIHKLVLNDLDRNVYAFWKIVCSNQYKELNDKILEYSPIKETYFAYQERLKSSDLSDLDRAFYFLVINRCSFSGIQMANPKSDMKDRWIPKSLTERIKKIHSMSDYIEVRNNDAMELIEEMYWNPKNCIFIDPPYIEKGDQLYPVKFHLHQELAELITDLLREFPGCADLLLTYDDQEILHQLYNQNHIGIHIIGRNYSCRR